MVASADLAIQVITEEILSKLDLERQLCSTLPGPLSISSLEKSSLRRAISVAGK